MEIIGISEIHMKPTGALMVNPNDHQPFIKPVQIRSTGHVLDLHDREGAGKKLPLYRH